MEQGIDLNQGTGERLIPGNREYTFTREQGETYTREQGIHLHQGTGDTLKPGNRR